MLLDCTLAVMPSMNLSPLRSAAATNHGCAPVGKLVNELKLPMPLPSAIVSMSAHGLQTGPPQSTSVSIPFLTLSMQVAATHTPAAHVMLRQSPLTLHFLPPAQPGHRAPPQSTSVSAPFLVASVHVGTE